MSGDNIGFQAVTPYLEDQKEHRREIATKVNTILQGKINVFIDVTLRDGHTTTTLTDARIGYYSAIVPAMAMTANAATAITAGIWVNGVKSGQATLNHASSANTDQTIRFLIIG